MNRMKNDPIWNGLREELQHLLGDDIRLVFPESWSDECTIWFREVEQNAFRPQLQCSEADIQERLQMEGVLALFMFVDTSPEGVILGYHLDDAPVETFYLDTIAVKQKGKGIGPILIRWLVKWAKKNGYEQVALDTELENERGIHLRDFYLKLGFKQSYTDETGNIFMSLDL